jgi:hypothetical protein
VEIAVQMAIEKSMCSQDVTTKVNATADHSPVKARREKPVPYYPALFAAPKGPVNEAGIAPTEESVVPA